MMVYLKSHTLAVYDYGGGYFAGLYKKRMKLPVSVPSDSRAWGDGGSMLHRAERPGIVSLSFNNKINVALSINLRLMSYSLLKRLNRRSYFGLAADTINTDYEWYLQRNKLNRVYDMYMNITRLLKPGRTFVNRDTYVGDLIINKMTSRFASHTPVYSETAPYGVSTVLSESRGGITNTPATESYSSENRIQISREVVAEGKGGTPDIYNIINNNINMRHIAEMVGRDIEGRLRLERLKKGY